MLISIVLDYVLTGLSLVSSQDFYCSLPRDQSRNVTSRLTVYVILQCTSFPVHASSFQQKMLRNSTPGAQGMALYVREGVRFFPELVGVFLPRVLRVSYLQ